MMTISSSRPSDSTCTSPAIAYSDLNLLWKKIYEVFVQYVFLPVLKTSQKVLDQHKAQFYEYSVTQALNREINAHVIQSNFWTELKMGKHTNDYIALQFKVWSAIQLNPEIYNEMPEDLKRQFTGSNFSRIWGDVEAFFKRAFPEEPMKLQNILFECLKTVLYPDETEFFADYKAKMYKELSIPVSRGSHINCMIINAPNQLRTPADEQQWVVYFCPNGQAYEEKLKDLQELSRRTGKNLIAMNYRGVGQKDVIPAPQDFEEDGKSVVEHLLNLGVQTQNITTWGNSLGGCVALNVAQHYQKKNQEMSVVSDKTFTTYLAVVEEMFRDEFHGIGNLIIKVMRFVVVNLGLNFDAISSFHKIKGSKYIIEHPKDGVIKLNARLGFRALQNWKQSGALQLQKPVVILDSGHVKVTHDDTLRDHLMTKEGFGAHNISWLRRDKNNQLRFSDAYESLFKNM